MSKSIFKSKTFWINILGLVATYGGVLPVTPEVAFYVLSGANIGLRVITKGAVHVLSDAASE